MYDEVNAEGKDVLTDWAQAEVMSGVCVGRIVRCESSGPIMVIFESAEPKKARIVAGLNREELGRAAKNGREVLIVFENGDIDRPIIVALMEQEAESPPVIELPKEQVGLPKQAVVDGQTVKIEARNQIILECGKSSITLRKDGKIVVKGAHLLSRSSGPNRIKGSSVNIN